MEECEKKFEKLEKKNHGKLRKWGLNTKVRKNYYRFLGDENNIDSGMF